MTTIGSLFTGYGGLDLAVENVFSACTAWVSDIEPGPQAVLAHRFPSPRQLGDITAVDWGEVEPVDIITGGSPCQDISAAGRRAGMTDGTRSNLWVQMREAIRIIQPSFVIWENVRGAHSARATSDMELEPGRVGGPNSGPFLRATGRVLGDLSGLGFDAEWVTLPASEIGAPHRRERVFVLAWRRDAGAPHALRSEGWRGSAESGTGPAGGAHASTDGAGHRPDPSRSTAAVTLLPTPCAQHSGNSPEEHLRKKPGRERVTDLAILVENDLMESGGKLLPTPRVSDHAGPGVHGSGGMDLRTAVAAHLLPTPRASEGEKGGPNQRGSKGDLTVSSAVHRADFGVYSPAIQRWEAVIGRPAPDPTEINPDKRKRCAVHAVPPEARSREELRDVRDSAVPQEVCERTARGQERVPAEEVLLPIVREHEEGRREERSPLASTPDAGERVRGVRDGRGPTRAPSGPEYCEQHPGELGDALRELPPTAALAGGPREAPGGEPLGDPCTCGRPRLSAKFTEWMMGLPAGWVTDPALGLSRVQQLRLLGNGVVPQQAEHALRLMLARSSGGAA